MSERNALITGAGHRIGRAIARSLTTHGWRVAVHYNRSKDAATRLAREIIADGGHAVALGADLMCDEAATALIGRAASALGPITALINNASVFEPDDVMTVTRESWDRHMQVNLRAPFVLAQSFARALPAEATGVIINMIDHRVLKLNPQFMSYTLAKAGLWTLTQTLAQALAPRIRVNAIGPGPVLASIHQSDEIFQKEAKAVLLQRGPGLDEINDAVEFLLSASTVTGQMIALDGGQHLAWQTPDLVTDQKDNNKNG